MVVVDTMTTTEIKNDDYYYNDRDYQYNNNNDNSNRRRNDYNNDSNYNYGDNNDRFGDGGVDDYYNYGDEYGGGEDSSTTPLSSRLSDMMPNMIKTGNRQIGVPLLGIGMALTVLGMTLFFNKTLMRLGNLFFVAGVPMTLGPGRTAGYFLQQKKARATACLVSGIFLVFVGWPILGLALEVFGLLNLFGNMFPFAFALLKQMPVIGPLLRGDVGGGGGANGGGRRGRNDDRYDDYLYDDDGRDTRRRDGDRDGGGSGGNRYNDYYDDDYGSSQRYY